MSEINNKRNIIRTLKIIEDNMSYDYEEEYKKIYNACSNDDEILSYLEEQNYITTEDEERVISENSDSIDRLRYFIGDTHSADVYRIDGYGNLENIDIDDLKGLCEDLIDELRRQIQTIKDSEMS